MVRKKNVLSTIMHSFVLAAVIGVQWALVGYSIAYSFVVSLVLFTLLKKTIGLRPVVEDEIMGIDLTEHGEAGYN